MGCRICRPSDSRIEIHASRSIAGAMALIDARDFVQPEDVQAVFLEVAAHRLVPQADSGSIDDVRRQQAAAILERVAIP